MPHTILQLLVSCYSQSHSWPTSHAFIGCYFSLGDTQKAQQLLDTIPSLLERKKVGGKDLPTEVFIKKKCMVYSLPATLWFIDGFGG